MNGMVHVSVMKVYERIYYNREFSDEYEYEGVVHEDDLYFYRNCIHTFNFLEYHDSVKLVSNLDEFSKKRCEYFFYYLASEAMKKANEIED